jgi:GTP cyclohydrolase IA
MKNTQDKSQSFLKKLLKKLLLENQPESLDEKISLTKDDLENEKIKKIEFHFLQILETLGLDLENESIKKTPYRIAKMYVKELFWGLNRENFPKISLFDFDEASSEQNGFVLIKDIELNSTCEHHFMPMNGFFHIAYLPYKKIIGLSKINRIANYFCKKPQLQERLTMQIAKKLSSVLNTQNIAVYSQAVHHCVRSRGIKDNNTYTDCYYLMGKFKDDISTKDYFLSKIPTRNI